MISAVIIEDELKSQELLKTILEEYCDNVEVIGVSDSVQDGIKCIKELKPQMVFLDVEINGGTGFDVLTAFDNPDFKTIFVTGYNHYAIKAIKYSALDYILKPINLEEIKTAIQKVTKEVHSDQKKINFLKENIFKDPGKIDQFVLSDTKGHKIVKIEDILFIEADGSYITIFLEEQAKHISSNPLHFYESILPDSLFYRIHKSYLVNIKKILKVNAGRGGQVEMLEGFQLPIAYRRKAAFLKALKNAGFYNLS